jgi:hypothetical protein
MRSMNKTLHAIIVLILLFLVWVYNSFFQSLLREFGVSISTSYEKIIKLINSFDYIDQAFLQISKLGLGTDATKILAEISSYILLIFPFATVYLLLILLRFIMRSQTIKLRRSYYSRLQSYLTVGIIVVCVFLGWNNRDKFGLGSTDPDTGYDKRAVEVLRGPITHVRDGDTIEVNRIPIRIAALDCPENSTSEGKKATRFAKQFKGKQAVCELTGKTTYDRKVGYCSINGKPFAQIMVENTTCVYWCKYDVWNRFC